jgi:hypothetical protein
MLRNRLCNLGGEVMRLSRPDKSGLAMTKGKGARNDNSNQQTTLSSPLKGED